MKCILFFLKQKTAEEMRISDWISDLCSSDLRSWCLGRGQQVHGEVLMLGRQCRQGFGQIVPGSTMGHVNKTNRALVMLMQGCAQKTEQRSEERRVGKECVS